MLAQTPAGTPLSPPTLPPPLGGGAAGVPAAGAVVPIGVGVAALVGVVGAGVVV